MNHFQTLPSISTCGGRYNAAWDVYELQKQSYRAGTFMEKFETCGDYGCDYDYREVEYEVPVRPKAGGTR